MTIGWLQYFINDHQEYYNAQWVTCFGPPCDCNFFGQRISTHYLKRWIFIDIFDNSTLIIRNIIFSQYSPYLFMFHTPISICKINEQNVDLGTKVPKVVQSGFQAKYQILSVAPRHKSPLPEAGFWCNSW